MNKARGSNHSVFQILVHREMDSYISWTEKLQSHLLIEQTQARYLSFYFTGEHELRQLNSALTKTQHLLEEAREKEESAIALEQDIRAQFNKLSSSYEDAQSK